MFWCFVDGGCVGVVYFMLAVTVVIDVIYVVVVAATAVVVNIVFDVFGYFIFVF